MPTLDDVYRKFGEVSESAQQLEQLIRLLDVLIGCVHEDSFTFKPELFSRLLSSKKTLGQRLAPLFRRKSADIESGEGLVKLLADALAARNRLMHSFFAEHGARKDSDEGRAIMMSDLEAIHDKLKKAYAAPLSPAKTGIRVVIVPDKDQTPNTSGAD